MKRKMVNIDEEKCNGCGLCITACHEGALQIVNGKAKLVGDVYCDGLGDCLGHCPQEAISIDEREVEDFDMEAVKVRMERTNHAKAEEAALPCGCPGSLSRSFEPQACEILEDRIYASQLRNWPVQIRLVPEKAPFLDKADLLLCADCVPFALDGFHSRFVRYKVVLVGCPKLDDGSYYVRKLAAVFMANTIRSISILYMEVPCCSGLLKIVRAAVDLSDREIPLTLVKVGVNGDIL